MHGFQGDWGRCVLTCERIATVFIALSIFQTLRRRHPWEILSLTGQRLSKSLQPMSYPSVFHQTEFSISLVDMTQASPSKTLLLAEDDEDDYVLFCEAIKDAPAPVVLHWVKNGEELMAALKQDKTDIIFLDINMPLKNGFECLTEIRGDDDLKETPVIIYSTSDDSKLIDWMYNAGANLYLCKPTDFKKLKNRILKAIGMDWQKQRPYSQPEHFVLG